MQEVHIDKPSDSWRFKTAPAGEISEFHDKARSAHEEAGKEGRDGARGLKSRPQDSEYETSRDGRADIGLHALQVDIELAADVVDEWDPQQAQQHHDAGRNSSKIYKLFLGSLRPELLIKIESDECGSRVENRTHRAHDRRQ